MKLTSQISAVTVYADRARVTRSARVDLVAGEHTLHFSGLPAGIDARTVQVDGTGKARLRDVGYSVTYHAEISDDQVRAAYDEQQRLEDELRRLTDHISAAKSEEAFVQAISVRLTTVTEKGQPSELDPAKWVELTEFYRRRRDSLMEEIRSTEIEVRAVNARLERITKQIDTLGYRRRRAERTVTVVVEAQESCEIGLALSYIVEGASWRPAYDLRVDSAQQSLEITYSGLVSQHTGESWEDAALRLSTAAVNVSGTPPELEPWRVGEYEPTRDSPGAPLRAKKAVRDSQSRSEVSDEFAAADSEEGAMPSEPEIDVEPATVETGATAVEFVVAGTATIGSDDQPHRLTIMIKSLPVEFRYSCVPKLAERAYLTARATNTTGTPLLAGQSSVFLDNRFVATADLGPVAPNEEFWCSLGVDEGMKVTHTFVNRTGGEQGVFSKSRRLRYEYLLEVTNHKPNRQAVVVIDQIPLTGNEKIVVELLDPKLKIGEKSTSRHEQAPFDGAARIDDRGILEWRFTLDPSQSAKIPLAFAVEHPRSMHVTGL